MVSIIRSALGHTVSLCSLLAQALKRSPLKRSSAPRSSLLAQALLAPRSPLQRSSAPALRRPALRRPALCGVALIVALALAACRADPAPGGIAPSPTAAPQAPQETAEPAPAAAPEPPDSGWLPVAEGVEVRRMRLPMRAGVPDAVITGARLDPARVRFRVGYSPGAPLALADWLDRARPLALITGGFFSESFESTALVVSGGVAAGESYVGRGGMFAVGRDGAVALRSLADQPYDPAEPLDEAVQGWPILVRPGGELAYTGGDPDVARRSVVALDHDGRVLLLACATSSFTLAGLASWLAASDLQVDAALNLDGGKSTALFLEGAVTVEPFVRLPLVLLAERK